MYRGFFALNWFPIATVLPVLTAAVDIVLVAFAAIVASVELVELDVRAMVDGVVIGIEPVGNRYNLLVRTLNRGGVIVVVTDWVFMSTFMTLPMCPSDFFDGVEQQVAVLTGGIYRII